ncbi:MAG: hypothetical protein IKZ38_00795 [Clostridia bacterium]|nr:hypothetical protein [Clostridia bacterium]
MYYKVCKRCGYSFADFKTTGLLGCPDCYKSFQAELMPTIKKIHSSTLHTGKSPAYEGMDKELLTEYKRLIAERQECALSGRFSDMAELSIRIDSLAEELKKRGLI